MTEKLTSYVPDEAELRDIAKQVTASHLFLIQPKSGGLAVLSPSALPGHRVLMHPSSPRLARALQVAA